MPCGSHSHSPPKCPLPAHCFIPAPNSSRRTPVTQRPLLPGKQAGGLQIFTSVSLPVQNPQSHLQLCSRKHAAVSISPLNLSPVDHKNLLYHLSFPQLTQLSVLNTSRNSDGTYLLSSPQKQIECQSLSPSTIRDSEG